MSKILKLLTLFVCLLFVLPGVQLDEKTRREVQTKIQKRDRFKIKWLPYYRWKRWYTQAKRWWKSTRWIDRARWRWPYIKYEAKEAFRGFFSDVERVYQKARLEIEEAVWRRDFERLKVVLNDVAVVDSGAGLEIGQTYFRETWPSSADGTYTSGTIHADNDWTIGGGSGRYVVVEDGWVKFHNMATGGIYIMHVHSGRVYKHKQAYRVKFYIPSDNGNDGGIMYIHGRVGYDNIFTITIQYSQLGGQSITKDTVHELLIVCDFIEGKTYAYLDGGYSYCCDFGSMDYNSFDRLVFNFYGSATAEKEFWIGDILIADTIESSAVYFYDTANEDNLDDYTKGGNTHPTWDSTEKAYKLYDNAAGTQYSQIVRRTDTPEDNVEFRFMMKIGNNDTSTHINHFIFIYRDATDIYTHIKVRYNAGSNVLLLYNIVDGTTYGSDSASWTPTAGTWYYFKVVVDFSNKIRLFRGTSWNSMVEVLSLTPTKSKRFYTGELNIYGYHNDGETLEIFIKNIEITASPKVLAPRSNPPWLLTQSIRPDVTNTLWEELAGRWGVGTLEDDGGIFGNSINHTDTSNYIYVLYYFSGLLDITNRYAIRIVFETDNITDISRAICQLNVSGGTTSSKSVDVSGVITVNKKLAITFWLDEFSDPSGHDKITGMKIQLHYLSSQTATIKVSDIQFLGGGAHHVAGEPLYQSPGYDDLAEWDTSGSTGDAPTWDGTNELYNFEDNTAADNVVSLMERDLKFNMNGSGALKFKAQIQADDTNTDRYWHIKLYNDSDNAFAMYWTGNTMSMYLRSDGTNNYGGSYTATKDNNEHEFLIYFNKDEGVTVFMDGKKIIQDNSISGSWVDWSGTTKLYIQTRHDNGEKSHVHIPGDSIKVERYPLQIWKGISNGLEELTDSLAPEDTLHGGEFDGTWMIGYWNVATSGNPLTNGKYIYSDSVNGYGGIYYEFDSAVDMRWVEKVRLFAKLNTQTTNIRFRLKDSSGDYYEYTLSGTTSWKFFEFNISDMTQSGTPDISDIVKVIFFHTGTSADVISVYGLQFLAPMAEEEHYVPITWEIEEGLEFDNNKVSCGNIDNAYTVMTWVRVTDIDAGNNIVNRASTYDDGYALNIQTNGKLSLLSHANGNTNGDFSSIKTITENESTCVGFIWHDTYQALIINGAINRERNVTHEPPSTSDDFIIGGHGKWWSYYLHGYATQILAYNRRLEPWEIAYNYHNPKNPIRKGLVLWLDPDSVSGSTWADKSGNGNDGTIHGATLKTGAFYMGPNEKAELYRMNTNGHFIADEATIKFVDLWGAGFGGVGSWEWEVGNTDISGMNDDSVEAWGFWGGSWKLPNSITVDRFGVYDGASVLVSDRIVSDVGNCVIDDGVLGVKISALQVDIYSTSDGYPIFSVPMVFTADTMINLKTGKITIPSDLTLSAVEYQAGTTIEVDSGYTLYARSISGSGTLTGTTKILKESIVDAPLDISHTHVADYTNEAGW